MGAGAELIIAAVLICSLLLLPLASRMVREVGGEISAELDGGRTGRSLGRHLDREFAKGGGGVSMRAAEIRQMLEARTYMQRRRGKRPLDVEAELVRMLRTEGAAVVDRNDPELIDAVRQLVIAHNARRARRGESQLDVDAEIERQLHSLG